MSRIWFITGSSRGIGYEAARAALAAGDRVAATGRDLSALQQRFAGTGTDRLLPLALDVADSAAVQAAVDATLAHFGRIDVLLNNAGYGQLGLFEEIGAEATQRQFATNVFGLFDVTRAVLPAMRRQRSGRILNITSVGGIIGVAGGGIYCAGKFAVEGFSEALAAEVEPFGIRVTIVGPGYFRTDFLDASSIRHGEHAIADYAEASRQLRNFFDGRNRQQAGDPAKLGRVLVELAHHPAAPLRFSAGSDAVEVVRGKIARLAWETDAFEALSRSTDFA
ncbi:oxidoreductase [Tahibacter caeni]|uniref:oxidoreductase n=1 Tax=Tahibacter caeni TaxID=1453545 RepID=UPI002147DD2C|nr:oxidoreductase [Tahibacter caeni]